VTESERQTILEIEDAAQGTRLIPASKVKVWLTHRESVEILGAVAAHVIQNSRRVDPPLSMEEICGTLEEYFKRCLIEDRQDSQYAPNRSIAGLSLVSWFRTLWHDPAVPRTYLERLKAMLRRLCLEGHVPQEQMAGAVLEHLFEDEAIGEFFVDWRDDSRLTEAFDAAEAWARDHRSR
jgi:hypothetical protein